MSTVVIIVIVVVVALLLMGGLAAARIAQQRRRTKQLRDRFGPEYDRAVEQHGGRKEAEAKLTERQERREKLEIRPLEPEQQERFSEEWRRVQGRFVDAPQEAAREADHLVKEVMRQRGYPIEDFDQRADDISVDHPSVIENYRSAGRIAERNERGEASTEDLRQATVHYRALFEELLGAGEGGGRRSGAGGRGEQAGGAGGGEPGAGGRREEVR